MYTYIFTHTHVYIHTLVHTYIHVYTACKRKLPFASGFVRMPLFYLHAHAPLLSVVCPYSS